MKGKYPGLARSITSAIKKMSKDSQEKNEFIYVTEAFTGQTCNQCKTKKPNKNCFSRIKTKNTCRPQV